MNLKIWLLFSSYVLLGGAFFFKYAGAPLDLAIFWAVVAVFVRLEALE